MGLTKRHILVILLVSVMYSVSGGYRPCAKCAVIARTPGSSNFREFIRSEFVRPEYAHSRPKRVAQKPEKNFDKIRRLNNHKSRKDDNYTQPISGTLVHHPDHYGRNPKKPNKMLQLYDFSNAARRNAFLYPGTECNFEIECRWTWKPDIPNVSVVASSYNLKPNETGPQIDADNNRDGHYLLIRMPVNTTVHITSPMFPSPNEEGCRVQLSIYQESMKGGTIRIVVHHINKTQVVVDDIIGDDSKKWKPFETTIGKTTQEFSIILDVVAPKESLRGPLVAFDNIKLLKCFPEINKGDACTNHEYRCSLTNICINNSKVCDITRDCANGDDETQNCDKVPYGARCTFEQDWCGWISEQGKTLQWTRHHGVPGSNLTGPTEDHTFGNITVPGKYLHVAALKEVRGFANIATLRSVIFNPPPKVHGNSSSKFYNSCSIRFQLHQADRHKSGFMLQVTELRPKENISTELLWSYTTYHDTWIQQIVTLPNITYRYYLHFDVRTGVRYIRDIAIDDFSLSPECFGLNIPAAELNGYNYYNPDIDHPANREPHKDFANETYYELTTCGQKGRYGPVQEQCVTSYNNTHVKVKVLSDALLRGVQKWTVPSEGYYTFILFGAGGGKGSGAMGSSRGAMSRVILELRKGQEIYMVVGQEGTSACVKSLGYRSNTPSSCEAVIQDKNITGVRGVLNTEVMDGGGGGGGASYLFVIGKSKKWVPVAVAAGGGGLGLGRFIDSGTQHGQGMNLTRNPVTGEMSEINPSRSAGAGGGWTTYQGQVMFDVMGQALTKGGLGGRACYNSTNGKGDGGFGGGGGGCKAGGGGGGYAGGNAWLTNTTNGEGGYSFVDPNGPLSNFSEVLSGNHAGSGSILIIPGISGCGCNYRCLALDAQRSKVVCICPKNWKLDVIGGKECLLVEPLQSFPPWTVSALIAGLVALTGVMGILCFLLYNRYQHRAAGMFRRKGLSGLDLQLNRLRVASDSMMTEYNPNYEFGGAVYTLKDLKDIPRDQLRLVKALGQGAFGEVYQGFYRQRSGDAVEMPVAVKTLPEMSTKDAEMDFLMEALIMSKFNHPNIVHFIGVCFDKHPRFIVLELLAGGDLKNFLRESRPKPERGSPLSMKDLVLIAVDIAKGCKYLEENRFLHRDLAARNCLLTTKGPGRVVKIADFGMSRDIYRNDYYRKGGKAMLPIKWMPPEAYLDGMFSSKTDVWSFGVLLWEIMSMGYMPYTGLTNREVMSLVTNGGRLEPPTNCPGPIYGIMTQCWHPTPDERPTFGTILERLGYCLQDPLVMDASLPVFSRPPSHERDATVMRPNNTDESCLQVPQATDYLIPNHTMTSTAAVGSTSSVDKLLPDTSDSWETSFSLPNSTPAKPDNELEAAVAVPDQLQDTNQNGVTRQRSPPNGNNNCAKPEPTSNTLISGLSLDAGALIKQSLPMAQSKKYPNIGEVTANGVITNGSYANSNNYLYGNAANKFVNESEISC